MENTTNQEKEWHSKELLEFYKSFSSNSFVHASLQDREMKSFIHTVCFCMRSDFGKKIYYEGLNENYMKDIVSASFHSFLVDLEGKIESEESKLFYWVFRDSELYLKGGIFSMEEAVYAMRDEILGVYVSYVSSRLGSAIFQNKDQMGYLKDLITYNPAIHKGIKYNCYKNHLLSEWYGQMILGGSMIFQGEMDIEDVVDFDSYCDKFEPYFLGVLEKLEIDGNSFVDSDSFSTDIKRILDYVLDENDSLIEYNYEVME